MSTIPTAGTNYYVQPHKQPKSQAEIIAERAEKDAIKSKNKPIKDRNVGDYINIYFDKINKIKDSTPVIYATENNKLNYTV